MHIICVIAINMCFFLLSAVRKKKVYTTP